MNCVYVVHTPYHLLLSCGLASSYDYSNKKYLIIIPDFKDADLYYQAILDWDKSPFTYTILLSGVYNIKFGHTIKTFRDNIKTLNLLFKKQIKDSFVAYIFNDDRVEGQFVSYINFTRNGLNNYVEDGSAAYNCYLSPETNNCAKLIYKLIYGSWYDHIRVLGTSKYIDQVMVFRPEIIRQELKHMKITKIHSNMLEYLDKGFIDFLLKYYSINLDYQNYDCILIVPHSDFAKNIGYNHFKDIYLNILDLLTSHFDNIGVKYHPRENMGDFLCFNSRKIRFIPNPVPIEVIWISIMENPPQIVIGDISTSLLTCELILKNKTNIISTVKILNLLNESNMIQLFNNVGVRMPAAIKDLSKIISNITYKNL